MNTQTLLRCEAVSRSFGGLVANHQISLDIFPGEILGLIGPNGAGKSTLFNLIAGAFFVSDGRIVFNAQDITKLPAPARCHLGLARTFQVPRAFDTMRVVDNVIVGALVRYPRFASARDKALSVLDEVGLAHRALQMAGNLTPPEKRRLEIARALATEPRLLLLDEVLTGLTPSEAQEGVALIKQIRQSGVTVVMVEHVMDVVMALVDRVVVLHLGEVLAEGAPQDIVRNAAVISAYLGERARVA